MLPIINPLSFLYQVTKYLNYEEWIRLLELGDQPIIQTLVFFLSILDLGLINWHCLWKMDQKAINLILFFFDSFKSFYDTQPRHYWVRT